MRQYKSALQYHMFGTRVINYHGKNFEQGAAIKFCRKVGFKAAKMWEMFVKVFGDLFVSHATEFQTTKTNENIARVAAVLKDDSVLVVR